MPLTLTSRRTVAVTLCAYSVLLAVALLAPTSGTQSSMASWLCDLGVWIGFSEQTATPGRAEFIANVLILLPVSALGSLIWPRTTWRDWTAYAFVIAGAVECAQGLLLPHRFASYSDVVANTLGGLLGAVFVAVFSLRRTAAGTRPTTRD